MREYKEKFGDNIGVNVVEVESNKSEANVKLKVYNGTEEDIVFYKGEGKRIAYAVEKLENGTWKNICGVPRSSLYDWKLHPLKVYPINVRENLPLGTYRIVVPFVSDKSTNEMNEVHWQSSQAFEVMR